MYIYTRIFLHTPNIYIYITHKDYCAYYFDLLRSLGIIVGIDLIVPGPCRGRSFTKNAGHQTEMQGSIGKFFFDAEAMNIR